MKKEVIFDLKDINSKRDLIKDLHEPLALQVHEGSSFENWDAFDDDFCSFNFEYVTGEKPTEVNLILTNWLKFESRFPDFASTLLSILAKNTDPSQRIDGINFTFQIRL